MSKKFFTFILSLSVVISYSFSQSGWFWQNPIPTGNDLEKMYFVNDSIGYGVGWGSTVIKTNNGGNNWVLANNGIKQLIGTPGNWNGILTSLFFYNSETGYVCGYNCVLKTTTGGNNWIRLNMPGSFRYYDIFFINENSGFTMGDQLLKTTNAGFTWDSIPLGFTSFGPKYMCFPSNTTGYILFQNGYLLKTGNGGLNWITINVGYGYLEGLYFLNNQIGYCFSNDALIKTSNGGLNWQQLDYNINGAFKSIFFLSEQVGFISNSNGNVYKTTDGGSNWSYISLDNLLLHVIFKNNTTGFISGIGGVIFRSSNQGNSWNCITTQVGTYKRLNSINFTSSNTGYIVGDSGVVLKSTDSGDTWAILSNQLSGSLRFLSFINDNTGFVSGGSKFLHKTTNGGYNSVSFSPVSNLYVHCVRFINSNTGFISGGYIGFTNAYVYKTTDAGITWNEKLFSVSTFEIIFTNFLDSFTGFFFANLDGHNSRIYKTENSGDSWFQISGLSSNSIEDIEILDSMTMFTITDNALYKSTNGGYNWQLNLSQRGFCIRFLNYSTGFIPGFKTTNNELNWYQQETQIMGNELISGMYFVNNDRGFMVGGNGASILNTTDGGNYIGIIKNTNIELRKYYLLQNYPNPFNPTTKIRFDIPVRKGYNTVTSLIIYDILGREVTTLVNEQLKTGTYEVDWDGSNYSSGVYFYKLIVRQAGSSTGDFVQTKKMVLIR